MPVFEGPGRLRSPRRLCPCWLLEHFKPALNAPSPRKWLTSRNWRAPLRNVLKTSSAPAILRHQRAPNPQCTHRPGMGTEKVGQCRGNPRRGNRPDEGAQARTEVFERYIRPKFPTIDAFGLPESPVDIIGHCYLINQWVIDYFDILMDTAGYHSTFRCRRSRRYGSGCRRGWFRR